MKKQVLFIHGGGGTAHEADSKLANSLQQVLGAEYEVHIPRMPNADAPTYDSWKDEITKQLGALEAPIILVGHSHGGAVLMKYLSEVPVDKAISGLFLVAAPYWGAPDWEYDEYVLRQDFATHLPEGLPVFLYHSRDDETVPFSHLGMYAAKLPKAVVHDVDGRDHQFNNDLSEVATDISRIK